MQQSEPCTGSSSSSNGLQQQQDTRAAAAAAASHGGGGAADMTRRMVCGGLAGMIAKVRCCFISAAIRYQI